MIQGGTRDTQKENLMPNLSTQLKRKNTEGSMDADGEEGRKKKASKVNSELAEAENQPHQQP